MDGLQGHFAKWNKSEKDKIMYDINYWCNPKEPNSETKSRINGGY